MRIPKPESDPSDIGIVTSRPTTDIIFSNHEVVRLNPRKKSGLAQRHRVLVGCAALSTRYHDEIRVFSRLMAKSVVGNNQ